MLDEDEAIFGLRCFFTYEFAGQWPGGVFAQTTKIHEKNKAVLYDPASLFKLLDASEVQVLNTVLFSELLCGQNIKT